MDKEERHIVLFDKYVNGTLSKSEEKELNDLISNDPALKLEFESHKLLVDGIKQARKEELRDYLKEHGKVEYFENIWGAKWRKASAAIVFLFVLSFFIVQYIAKKNPIKNEVAKEQTITKEDIEAKNTPPKEEVANAKKVKKNPKESDKNSVEGDSIIVTVPNPPILVIEDKILLEEDVKPEPEIINREYKEETEGDELDLAKNDTDDEGLEEEKILSDTIVEIATVMQNVTADRVLSSRDVSTSLSTKKGEVESGIKDAQKSKVYSENEVKESKKLDTLSKKEVVAKYMKIEFWKSPLNFEGYQLTKKLKLYGVQDRLIRIIEYNNQTYLKIDNSYCRLQISTEYERFKYIQDKNLIKILDAH